MKVSSCTLVFEEMKYGDTKFMTLEIENEGLGLLEFEISRVLDKGIKNLAWLNID